MKLQHFPIPFQSNYMNADEFVKTYVLLAHPLKLEFVEVAGRIKSLLFRHFIYVNLGIPGDVCKSLPFPCKNA